MSINKTPSESKKKRVLYIQKPPGGGSAISLYELVVGMKDTEYEPVVLFYNRNYYSKIYEDLGVEVLHLSEVMVDNNAPKPKPNANILTGTGWSRFKLYKLYKKLSRIIFKEIPLALRIQKIIKDNNIDIVHHNNDLSLNRESIIAASLSKKKQVSHIRWLNTYIDDSISLLLDKITAKNVDFFVYISKAVEDSCKRINIPQSKGKVISNPFDLNVYADLNVKSEEIRNEFGVNEETILISNVGRIMPWKGQIYFIEAFAKVLKQYPDVKALVVGVPEGGVGSQNYYHLLLEKVKEWGLEDKVIFTGFRKDIPEIMFASQIIVHSSCEPEPFGRVIVEGMASNCAVIATNSGGAAEIFEHEKTGIYVSPKDSESMADGLIKLVSDRKLMEEIGEAAKKDVFERFSAEYHVESVKQIYNTILKP